MSSIRSILEKLVYPIVGPRCKTKDTDEFEYKDGDSRCAVCAMYEQVDQALLEIETKIVKAVGKMEPTNKFTINKDGSTNCTGQYDARARNRLRREISADIKKILK